MVQKIKNKSKIPEIIKDGVKHEDFSNRVNRTVVVDSKFGNDETALAESLSDPAKTIAKAIQLLKKTRKSKEERWVIFVRPGNYELFEPIPTNVTLNGSGLATAIYGQIQVTSDCEFINFKFIGLTLPCVQVSFKKKYNNAVALFFGVDLSLSPGLNCKKGEFSSLSRAVVKLDSKAINTTTLFKDCRLDFNLDTLSKGENNFIVTLSGRTEIFTSFIRTSSHPSVPTNIIENVGGNVSVELVTIVHQPPVNKINAPVAFFTSSSSDLLFSKDNRLNYLAKNHVALSEVNSKPIKNHIQTCRSMADIPKAIIGHLAKNNGVIKSRNNVSNWTDVIPAQDYVAFVTSDNTLVSVLNYETSHRFAGNVGALNDVRDPTENIKYLVSNDGILHQSGGRMSNPSIVSDSDSRTIHPKPDSSAFLLPKDLTKSFNVILPQDSDTNLKLGWTLQFINKSGHTHQVSSQDANYSIEPFQTGIYRIFTVDPISWEQIAIVGNKLFPVKQK